MKKMSIDDFIELVDALHDPHITIYQAYEFAEQKHYGKFGYRRYANYEVFKQVRYRRRMEAAHQKLKT